MAFEMLSAPSKKRVLITGAAGFIGSNLAKILLRRGHSVIGIDNLNYGFMRNVEPLQILGNFEFISWRYC